MASISTLSVQIGADDSDFRRGLRSAQDAIEDAFDESPVEAFGSAIEGAEGKLDSLVGGIQNMAAAAAGLFGLGEAISSAVDMGGDIVDLSRQLHTTTEEAQEMCKIFELTETDAGTATSALLRLRKTYESNNDSAKLMKATLEATGVSLTDNEGKFLSINEQLSQLAQGYQKAKEAGQDQEYLMNTLGVRGQALIGILEQYEDAQEAASQVKGVGMTAEDLEALENFGDEMNTLKLQAQQFEIALANAFMPLAQQLLPQVMSAMQSLAGFISEHKEAIAKVTEEVTKFYIAYTAISKVQAVFAWFQTSLAELRASIATTAAEETAAIAETTSAEEAGLAQRMAAIDSYYAKKAAQIERDALKSKVSSQEAIDTMIANLEELNAEHARVAARVTAQWNEAHASMVTGAERATVAVNNLTVAEQRAGAAATAAGAAGAAAGATAAGAAVRTTSAVNVLSGALNLLKANWLLVAWACWEAVKAFRAYMAEKASEKAGGGGKVYEYEGNQYTMDKNGVVSQVVKKPIGKEYTNESGNTYQAAITTTSILGTSAGEKEIIKAIHEQAGYTAKPLPSTPNTEPPKFEIPSIGAGSSGSSTGGSSGGAAKTEKETKPQEVEVQIPIREKFFDEASKYVGYGTENPGALNSLSSSSGLDLLGSNTCAAFLSAIAKQVGISGIDCAGADQFLSLAKERGAYRTAGSGYTPKKGDIIDWTSHVGISDGQGGYIANNNHSGWSKVTQSSTDNIGQSVLGWVDMDAFTGNQTVSSKVTKDSKAAIDALNKIAQAQTRVNILSNDIAGTLIKSGMTDYEKELYDIRNAESKKMQELNALQAKGAKTDTARTLVQLETQKKLEEAEKKEFEREKKRQQEIADYYQTGIVAKANASGNDKDIENISYQNTLAKLADEYEAHRKKLLNTKYATQQEALDLETSYHNQVEQAEKEHQNKLKEINANGGRLEGLKEYFASAQALEDLHTESEKSYCEQIKSLWQTAYMDAEKYQTTFFSSLQNNLSSGITDIITGTQTISSAFSSMAKAIIKDMTAMIVKGMVAKMLLNAFGFNFSSSGGIATTKLATGGFVSGPGTGTSDSIPAYLSNGEFVMTAAATKANLPLLEAMNGGLKAFAKGGVVTAPSVRHFANGGLISSGSNNAGCNVAINITNNSGQNVTAEQTGSHFDGEKWVVDVVMNAVATNKNGMRTILKGVANG